MYKIVDDSTLFFYFWGFSLKILSRSSLHFVGIRVFIVGYEKECEKSLFSKTGCTGELLTTGMSHEFQSLDNNMDRLYFLSYSDLAVLSHHSRVSCEIQSRVAF